MSFKNALHKAAGLFVELPPEQQDSMTSPSDFGIDNLAPAPKPVETKTVEQIVKESPGPNLDEIKVEPKDVKGVAAPGGVPQFVDIYKKAGLPEAGFGAEQAIDMINALPADLPMDTKRKTVSVTMSAMGKSMGVSPESVVADASRKIAAISAYTEVLGSQTTEFIASTQIQIAALETEISQKKKLIDETKGHLDSALTTCKAETDRLDDVLEFFSLDVPPSKYAEDAKSTA
jgi:hypothetical protein